MKASKVTVGTTATQVLPVGATGGGAAGDIGYPTAAIVRIPTGSVTVYFGGPDVTTGQGCPFIAGEDFEIDLVGDILYAVVASSTQDIYVLRRGGV